MQQSSAYLLVVEHLGGSVIAAVQSLRQEPTWRDLGILLLTDRPRPPSQFANASVPVGVVTCDFARADTIAAALEPFRDKIRGVVCRGDGHIQQLRETLAFLPANVLTPSPQALDAATDKLLMRRAFSQHYPEITPKFVEAHSASPDAIAQIAAHMHYPVVIKPANLASSLLVQLCRSSVELKQALGAMYERIHEVYRREGRRQKPRVIVEEYLEGKFYSIDTYVAAAGEAWYCPPVSYMPAKQLGIDDFFSYKRSIPAELAAPEVIGANNAVAKAIAAVGLTHSSAHVELVRTISGWKVIELGPRLGRFRHKMYNLSYGIDHSLNDVKLHLGMTPSVLSRFKRYSAAYSIYPVREGILKAIGGLEELKRRREVSWLKVYAHTGDYCLPAKYGGHALAEVVLASASQRQFAVACEVAEKVYAGIA